MTDVRVGGLGQCTRAQYRDSPCSHDRERWARPISTTITRSQWHRRVLCVGIPTQHRATTPLSLLYSSAVGLPFTAVHNKPNPHDHRCLYCLIYTGNSGSNFFFGFVLSIMFRRAPSFCQLRLFSLKRVSYHSFVLKRIPVKRTLSEVNIHDGPPWVYIMYLNNFQPCGN